MLLAHLALERGTRSVLDPMAGHGDLLDAALSAAEVQNIALQRLDGIEIDPATAEACARRLGRLTAGGNSPVTSVAPANAFQPTTIAALPQREYDLVITNPPYVRYQRLGTAGGTGDEVRSGLLTELADHCSGADALVWNALAEGYSGLSDLSVPSWILAACLVAPGGRLAIVAPATWRTRNYADVLRYLMLRCFSLECVVEDQRPGWFSKILVRTNLLVARRLSRCRHEPLAPSQLPSPPWVQIAPEAAGRGSLVGGVFPGPGPESKFADWLHAGCRGEMSGVRVQRFDLWREWKRLGERARSRRWFRKLDSQTRHLPLLAPASPPAASTLPSALAEVLPARLREHSFTCLEETGVSVGQGLRTGCNAFFHVTACRAPESGFVTVETSALFGTARLLAPASVLRPTLRKQFELPLMEAGLVPSGRLLDLRRWILPEDLQLLAEAQPHGKSAASRFQIMPHDLAAHVRRAALTPTRHGKLIPELSAVRTNVRNPTQGSPRFWYMLPDLAPRHLPSAFVPRLNHDLPRVVPNFDPPLCIDANFSTLWPRDEPWTRHAIRALLSTVWCKAAMETLGTPMGGGALKLEATHLRQLPIPFLSKDAKAALDIVGQERTTAPRPGFTSADRIVLSSLCSGVAERPSLPELAESIERCALNALAARRGRAR